MTAPTPTDSTISPQVEPTKPSRVKRFVVGLGLFVIALTAAYGTGRLQTAGLVRNAEARGEEIERSRQATLAELASERHKSERLDARRHLHLALLALDDRNFGIAQSELAETERLLTRSGATAGDAFGKIAAEIRAQKLVATEDLNVQRQRLMGFSRALDQAFR